jgi:hypothetical protein
VVEHLPGKCKAIYSNQVPQKKRKRKKERKRKQKRKRKFGW